MWNARGETIIYNLLPNKDVPDSEEIPAKQDGGKCKPPQQSQQKTEVGKAFTPREALTPRIWHTSAGCASEGKKACHCSETVFSNSLHPCIVINLVPSLASALKDADTRELASLLSISSDKEKCLLAWHWQLNETEAKVHANERRAGEVMTVQATPNGQGAAWLVAVLLLP